MFLRRLFVRMSLRPSVRPSVRDVVSAISMVCIDGFSPSFSR